MNKRTRGFTLVEIMIVVAIIGLLATAMVPSINKARNKAQSTTCINNLKQIRGAIGAWALDNKKQDTDPVTLEDVKGFMELDSNGNLPSCPGGGTYSVTTVGDPPTCSLAAKGHKLP